MQKQIEIREMFQKYGISQAKIADLIGVNQSTFKIKFNTDEKYSKYGFNDDEAKRLRFILKKMRDDIISCLNIMAYEQWAEDGKEMSDVEIDEQVLRFESNKSLLPPARIITG